MRCIVSMQAGCHNGLAFHRVYVYLSSMPPSLTTTSALQDLVFSLDMHMQLPTVLLGDFNSSVDPELDFQLLWYKPPCPALRLD